MGSTTNDKAFLANGGDKMEPMAIIGMATKFPQEATSNENLWSFLLRARSAYTPFPKDRINADGHYHPDPEHGGTFAVKGGHFMIEDPALFDAPFFSVTKSEALTLDPQQRLLMENVYQALENAGIPMSKATSSNTSVFVSGFNHDHGQLLNMDTETTLKYRPTGTTNALLSNRVSWFFDFKAPSLTLDTACSSSMVALHLACQSLRWGESDMSVVSGVTMISYPNDINSMSHHGFLGQQGRSFSFDHRADGYARGEGVGSVIVKRLSDAIRDGDTIRAVIRGTAVNQDGRTAGISLPSATAQESLMRSVYSSAGLDVKETMMVEAHGTGTSAGDPIEAAAIAHAFASRSTEIPLYIGAIKSGIGHLEGGAGIASIIKSVLVLESGIIPPNVNFEKVNPKIPVQKWNIQFPLRNTPWPKSGLRRISINSTGVGGTNAHTIFEDAYNYLNSKGLNGFHNTSPKPPTLEEIDHTVAQLEPLDSTGENEPISNDTSTNQPSQNGMVEKIFLTNGTHQHASSESESLQNGTVRNGHSENRSNVSDLPVIDENGDSHESEIPRVTPRLFLLSSFDENGVKRNAVAYANYLKIIQPPSRPHEATYLADLAYTMSDKRSIFPWRSYALAENLSELIENLSNEHGLSKAVRVRTQPKVAFVFTGQGAQWHAMGRELLIYPVFKESVQDATAYMKSLGANWSLMEELLREKADSKVNQPHLAHPSCVALQVALVDLLTSWNLLPSRVMGHSSGEIGAAYCAGKLSREAAWKVSYFRGIVSAKQFGAKGAMMAVGLSEADIQPYLKKVNDEIKGEMIIACFNSPKNNTISGEETKIDALKKILDADNIFARKLNVQNAYHSAHMRDVADEYLDLIGDISPIGKSHSEEVHMFSTVTGLRVEKDHLDGTYWVDNMISPVRFTDALLTMCFSRLSKGQASLRMNSNVENVFADAIIELGPHAALQSAIKETVATKINSSLISYFHVLNRNTIGLTTILHTVGQLSSRGAPVNVLAVNEASNPGEAHPRLLVQLPSYVFNHSEKVMYESRLSRNYRLRKYPRHDLFGAPVTDWNAETPRWRHVIRLSEQPWLRDHVVTDSFVYPGVGYLVAVVEASRQMANTKHKVTGFRLHDISLKRALLVPDNKEGVEINLTLTRMDESSLWGSSVWKKFQISSYNPVGDDWIEHCTGYIAVDYETENGPIDMGREAEAEALKWKESLQEVTDKCVVPINIESVYDNLVTSGLTFGPLFRNVSEAKGTPNNLGEVTGLITVPDVAKVMPKNFTHPHLIHPTTMDSMMHLFIASVMDGSGKNTLDRAMIPTFIKDVWISAEPNNLPSNTFRGHGKAKFLAYDKYESDIMIWDGITNEARISIKGIRASPLESVEDASAGRKLCHNIEWGPDSEMLTDAAFSDVPTLGDNENKDYWDWINKFQLAALLQVTDALDELKDFDISQLDGHLLKYYHWMKQLREWLEVDKIKGLKRDDFQKYKDDPKMKAELYQQVREHNSDGELTVRMGSNIAKFLRKEVDPLFLMFGQDDLMDRVYEEVVHIGDIPAFQKAYLDVVGHNSTNLNILEIGAGTGSSTAIVLQALAPTSSGNGQEANSKVGKYSFTDISAGFFEKAKEKFKEHRHIMEFKTLNAEKDVLAQGFEPESYDFIIAGNVIHATADLRKTLSNLQSLLKPGGKLIMQEGIQHAFWWTCLSFGQLPGWWLAVEPSRKWSPWPIEQEWDVILKDSSFSGIDHNFPDRSDPELHTQSLFISSAVNLSTKGPAFWEKTMIVTTSNIANPSEIATAMKIYLEQTLKLSSCSIVNYLELATLDVSCVACISVMELERPVLEKVNEDEFNNIRQLLATCGGMIWVTGDVLECPELNMITGMTRAVRWERDVDEANLVTLSVSNPQPSTDSLAKSVSSLYERLFCTIFPKEKINGEYMLKNGVFLSGRLIEGSEANNYLMSKFSKPTPVMQPLGTAGRPVKLQTSAPGLLNKLEFVTDPVYFEPLEPTQVEIEIKAVGLNFRDLMIAMGEHMAYAMGNEAAGFISRVGSAVDKVSVGDRVVFLCAIQRSGSFHTYGRVDQNFAVRIPDSLSFENAAGLPTIYATVIYGLVDAAHLQKGETILIHAAAGGVGQAAIQFSKHVGAEVFATVSSVEKKELLMNEYGIPEDHIFSSRDLTFVQGVMRMTGNRGVDVVLNSLAGEALRRSWDLVAPFGRFVEIGKKDAQASGKIELNPFLRNVTMTSVELPTLMRHAPHLITRLIKDMISLYEEGKIKEAVPTKIMNYTQIEEGLRVLQSGKGMGKMIFVPSPEDVVPIVPEQSLPYSLEAEASYVLSGGLGGIGRSLGRWMVARGAKNLIFLSRTGNITNPVQDMVTELESKGCNIRIYTCDVTDKARLTEVIEECKTTMPPIKGCIQGAMILKDGMFENMTYETFQIAVKPKVQGSRNLHEILPQDMDFFVLLSSATGILGNRSQANYAAGNTYQDALARHRLSKGLPAATIDLGTVLSVGYVAENKDRVMMSKSFATILEVLREDEIQTLIEFLMDSRSQLIQTTCQLICGLTDASMYRQRGIPMPSYLNYPLFTHLHASSSSRLLTSSEEDPSFIVRALLASATTLEKATEVVANGVRAKLSSLLAIPIDNIDPQKSVSSNGVDSLVAMEFRTYLAKDLGAEVPLLDILGTDSLEALSKKVAGASKLVQVAKG